RGEPGAALELLHDGLGRGAEVPVDDEPRVRREPRVEAGLELLDVLALRAPAEQRPVGRRRRGSARRGDRCRGDDAALGAAVGRVAEADDARRAGTSVHPTAVALRAGATRRGVPFDGLHAAADDLLDDADVLDPADAVGAVEEDQIPRARVLVEPAAVLVVLRKRRGVRGLGVQGAHPSLAEAPPGELRAPCDVRHAVRGAVLVRVVLALAVADLRSGHLEHTFCTHAASLSPAGRAYTTTSPSTTFSACSSSATRRARAMTSGRRSSQCSGDRKSVV